MEVYLVISIAIPVNLAHHMRRLNENLKQMICERERERPSIPYTKGDCYRVSSTLSSKLRMKKVF